MNLSAAVRASAASPGRSRIGGLQGQRAVCGGQGACIVAGLEGAGAEHIEDDRVAVIDRGRFAERFTGGGASAPRRQHDPQLLVDLEIAGNDGAQADEDVLRLSQPSLIEELAAHRRELGDLLRDVGAVMIWAFAHADSGRGVATGRS
jgi:hypothetical protein